LKFENYDEACYTTYMTTKYHPGLRPQDIVILLKILAREGSPWRQLDLAYELGLSQSEVTHGLERCMKSGLIEPSKRTPLKSALAELLIHGLKYVFPAQPGPVCRGLPTAHSAKPLVGKIVAGAADQYVWPYAEGETRGQSIQPLYPSVPEAAKKDPKLHELLALIDAIRVGRAREKKLATEELLKRLKDNE
jgi:hypothetical protein